MALGEERSPVKKASLDDLADPDQMNEARTSVRKRDARDLLADHVREIWDVVHTDHRPSETEFAALLQAVMQFVEPEGMLAGRQDAGEPIAEVADEAITGPVSSIELTVTSETRSIRDPNEIATYIRRRLVPTIDRLQGQSGVTPEARVDIVVQALEAIDGDPRLPPIVSRLYGHLLTQPREHRGPGFYATVGTLGGLLTSTDARSSVLRMFLYHQVLAGLWSVRDEADAGNARRLAASAVTVASQHTASMVADIFQEREAQLSDTGRAAIVTLMRISAATTKSLETEDDVMARLFATLGVTSTRPRDAATVIQDLATVATAWSDDVPRLIRLQATAALVTAAISSPRAAAAFFNAGVAVNRLPADRVNTKAQLLLFALGLSWAFHLTPTPADAILSGHGLPNAVNFLATVGRRQDQLDDSSRTAVRALARHLAGLARWAPLQRSAAAQLSLARLDGAARQAGVEVDGEFSPEALTKAVAEVITQLRRSSGSSDPIVDATTIVRDLMVDLGVHQPHLDQVVDHCVELREQPIAAALDLYVPFLNLPAGAAQVALADEVPEALWLGAAEAATTPVPSITSDLMEFSVVLAGSTR